MNNRFTTTNKYYLFALLVFILLVVALITVILFSTTSEPETTVTTIPTPTPINVITTREQSFREATTQPFYSDNTKRTGTLIVTSSLSEVRVMIDDGEHEATTKESNYPIQLTPFKITDIPTGEHMIRAAKPGYIFKEISFFIKPGEVTRVELTLTPIRSVD
jgi:hypothetical protein